MSYDLFFCWNENKRVDFDSVCDWAKSFPYFERKGNQLWYQNQETGVYFSLDFSEESQDDAEETIIPAGYFDAGLSFNLNFIRPSFFGYEAMPVVENLSKEFGLFIFDPQADEEHSLLRDVKTDLLLASWQESNHRAVGTFGNLNKKRPPRMTPPKSLDMWNYLKNKKKLEEKCGDQIFVPKLSAVRRIGSDQADLAFVYTQDVPCVVPKTDWVFIVRYNKRHFWSEKQSEIGVISAKQFQSLVGSDFEEFHSDEIQLQKLLPNATAALGKRIQNCEFQFPREEFEALALDGFVDTKLEAGPTLN